DQALVAFRFALSRRDVADLPTGKSIGPGANGLFLTPVGSVERRGNGTGKFLQRLTSAPRGDEGGGDLRTGVLHLGAARAAGFVHVAILCASRRADVNPCAADSKNCTDVV